MKFVMSYSCGKDSTIALHKMIEAGHEPVALVVMVNEAVDRSYFHGADREMLCRYEEALEIPMILCPGNGEYHTLTMDGPIFKKTLKFQTGEILQFGEYSTIEVW